MVVKGKPDFIEVMWAKIIVYSLIIVISLSFIIVAPKKIFQENLPFQLATSMAITSEDNFILFDYKVYSNEERFNTGLITDFQETKQSFTDRSEIVAVKIYGDSAFIEVREDYIFITSPDTPELNIEYYLVQSMMFDDIKIPCRTFIMLFTDISTLVNNIYVVVLTVVSLLVIAPISFKLTRFIVEIKRLNKVNQTTNDHLQ